MFQQHQQPRLLHHINKVSFSMFSSDKASADILPWTHRIQDPQFDNGSPEPAIITLSLTKRRIQWPANASREPDPSPSSSWSPVTQASDVIQFFPPFINIPLRK
jgi:hypothetical protein